jgi:vancomycin permeability regulator SanA
MRSTHSLPRTPLILACLVALAAAAALLGAQAPQAPLPAAKPDVRVAIVLGNAPAAADEPTAMQTARCLKAFELYKNGAVNKLLVTGGFTRDYISEARMMKIALVTYGAAPDDVLEEELAATTIENGLFAARMFDARGWPKTATIVSQAFHLPRAVGNYRQQGFEVQDAAAVDAPAASDFAPVLDTKAEVVEKAGPSDLIVVYEPYASTDPMPWPTPQLARRLRIAAALYHKNVAPNLVLYNDRYTRGPVNLATMMKIGLVSLGVPAANVKAVARGEYRRLVDVAKAYADKSAIVLTTATGGEALAPDAAPKWKVVFAN